MHNILDVCRLTRPARIRCRPQLIFPRSRISERHYAAAAAIKPSNNANAPETFGSIEYEDYKLARELAKETGDVKKIRNVKSQPGRLPNLLHPETFIEPHQEGFIASEAGPSKIDLAPVTNLKRKQNTKEPVILETASKLDKLDTNTHLRRNPVGVQLLSKSLHEQLFPGPPLPKPPTSLLEISRNHLTANGLSPDGAAILPEVNFEMPKLQGGNLRQHFQAIGSKLAEPYLSMAKQFADVDLPSMPETWETSRAGWTKYRSDGSSEAVTDLGDEKLVSFDVETLYKLSPYPVMATAASPTTWYSWLSPSIFSAPPSTPPPPRARWDTRIPDHLPHDLIPLFSGSSPTLAIGHNVGYDRARVLEEYSLDRTSTRWLDTLSLHVATRGITSVQRPAWIKHNKNKMEKKMRDSEALSILQDHAESEGDEALLASINEWSTTSEVDSEAMQKRWEDVTSANSLADVASLHCGYPVDKSIRSRFADESITHASQLLPELHDLLTYCANDVRITHDVYKKVFPLFLNSCPHPASFAGVLAMGNSFLPVDESWEEYIKNAESTYQMMNLAVKKALRVLAEKLRKEGLKEGDPWASQLDWTPKKARWGDATEGGSPGTAETVVQTPEEVSINAAEQPFTISSSSSSMTLVEQNSEPGQNPSWYSKLATDRANILSNSTQRYILPLILRISFKGHPVVYLSDHYWCFKVPHSQLTDYIDDHGDPIELSSKDSHLEPLEESSVFFRISGPASPRRVKLNGPSVKKLIKSGDLTCPYPELLQHLDQSSVDGLVDDFWKCAEDLKAIGPTSDWGIQLDWRPDTSASVTPVKSKSPTLQTKKTEEDFGTWPKWYHDLTAAPTNPKIPFGELDLTVRKSVSPLLLRMQWQGYPLLHSREHKWVYRVPKNGGSKSGVKPKGAALSFSTEADKAFAEDFDHLYYRLPHKDGEENVGNPLSKFMLKHIESGELASAAGADGDNDAAKAAFDATNMNVLCSYWISSRERIMDQMVVYPNGGSKGMILPQVITMGTVTRRAVEATWLTASNAKKNRVGSELKAMVRAPKGYAIVGADVDSEELWISSLMGDSQFGMHGATAIGWMTLEGTKSAGTDLHSKTANILGTSRDAAKVFNYSRIYGAGKKHAVQLLLQGDSNLTQEAAGKLATELYKATKGSKSIRSRDKPPAALPSLWYGGSESNLFNTLESVALSDRPSTPALGCGVTRALRKSYLEEGTSYLPSRINWVVQSSGVDYLHLLIVSMEYLIQRYDIKARYLISVHDEVRYLAKEEDKYRTALALQIANAWTRALFCFNLGIDDVPQGVAFFSAVDVDHVLRKEVDMSCVTPSNPNPIPAGESLDIMKLLEKTGGYLGEPVDGGDLEVLVDDLGPPVAIPNIKSNSHRLYLEAQATNLPRLAKRWLDSQTSIGVGGDTAKRATVVQVPRKPVVLQKR